MKHSEYNTIIDITQKTSIIYNALSDHFLLVSVSKKEKLKDIKYLAKSDVELFRLLKKGGFVIEDHICELDKVKELRNKVDFSNYSYQLIINPTLNCNFKCWYCYETHTNSIMNEETMERVSKFVENITKEIKFLTLGFFGGEPLLAYKKVVKPLILSTKEICIKNNIPYSFTFTTNGYLLNEEMISFFKENHVVSLQITLDGGKEEHDKTRFLKNGRGSYEKIIQNIKFLLKNGIAVHLRINYTDKNILSCNEIAYDLKDISSDMRSLLKIFFQKVWQNEGSKEMANEVSAMVSLFQSFNLNTDIYVFNNVRISCYGDKLNSSIINYNGDIYKCTAIDFEKTRRDGFLDDKGKIKWENNSLETRLNAKFKNRSCLSCRILPICNGACSQKALEYKDQDYCILHYSEKEKDSAVLDRFKSNIINNLNWKI